MKDKRIFFSVILFLSSFLLYLYCMSPTVSPRDSGELITASFTMGTAHPPGYPLYLITGRFFSLIPWGNPAYRLNLLSALFAGITVMILFLLMSARSALTQHRSVAVRLLLPLMFVLTFALSRPFFAGAVVAEVLSLNMFFLAVLLYSALSFSKRPSLHILCFFFFVAGLGLGNHHLLIFTFPGIAYLVFSAPEGEKKRVLRDIPAALFFLLLGFLAYIYLPIRAARSPVINYFGSGSILSNLFRVLLRRDYGTFRLVSDGDSFSLFGILQRLWWYIRSLSDSVTLPVLIIGIFSFFRSHPEDKKALNFLRITFILSGPAFVIVANTGTSLLERCILQRFYPVSHAVWTVMALYGASYILGCFKKSYPAWILNILMAFFICISFRGILADECRRGSYVAYDLARNISLTARRGGVILLEGDSPYFIMSYYLNVSGKRPDLIMINTSHIGWETPAESFSWPDPGDCPNKSVFIEKLMKLNPSRHLYLLNIPDSLMSSGKRMNSGLMEELVPRERDLPGSCYPESGLSGDYSFRTSLALFASKRPFYDEIARLYLRGMQQRSLHYLGSGDGKMFLKLLKDSVLFYPYDPSSYLILSRFYSDSGLKREKDLYLKWSRYLMSASE